MSACCTGGEPSTVDDLVGYCGSGRGTERQI